MSGVEALSLPNEVAAEPIQSMDDMLSDVFDRLEVNNGADRGSDGKFISPNPVNDDEAEEPVVETKDEGETGSVLEGAEAGEAQEADSSTPSEQSSSLPSGWSADKADVWNKIPADARADVAAQFESVNARLSSQGRELSEAKPLKQVADEFRHLLVEGQTPADGFRVLARAQANLENPQTRLQTLLTLIDSYDARQHVTALLTGQAQLPQQRPLSADEIRAAAQQAVRQELEQDRSNAESEAELKELTKDLPLYSQIPQPTMVQFIYAARSALGETASNKAVMNQAYELATDSIPSLKAQKVAAAKTAAPPRQVDTEAARRANSVNVTSTSTGKVQKLSLDDELSRIYDEHNRKRN